MAPRTRSAGNGGKARDPDNASLLSPIAYDDDAASLHSRSDQDTDSEDDELQLKARNSQELRAHDRMMLLEEDEVQDLVTTSRKRTRKEGESLLPLGNPLAIFTRKSRTAAHGGLSNNSSEDMTDEKRRRRRSRRREKRERLKENAEHGEDGELMYEMEEGGMKDGSSTGDSSEDSDEADRKRLLNAVAAAKVERARSYRRWALIVAIAAVAFSILFLVAWKLSAGRKRVPLAQQLFSNGTALFGPTTVIISLDGFRADFLQRGLTPRLNAFIKEGVSPKYMLPSFPSVTFPNHYTIATGLYPESHGIVGNTFFDPALGTDFYYTDPARSMDPKWWMGEPFWVTAERQGVRTAIHMWPGSEAHILGTEPSFLDEYNGSELLPKKVERLFEFLDMPGKEDEEADIKETRPQLVAMYVPNVDSVGHKYGPNSTEIQGTIREVDDMLDQIFKGLEERNLTSIVNIIVVSDHGMATTDVTRLTQLEDIVDLDKVAHVDGWPLVGLRPKDPSDLDFLYGQAMNNTRDNPNIDVYLRDVDMPARYHFSRNERIAPLWIVPKTGWGVVDKLEIVVADAVSKGEVYHPRGMHGYDHEHPLMRAIFVARGPAFPHPPNSQLEVFQNIEVYNMLCNSLGIKAAPNNGTLQLPLKTMGIHRPGDVDEPPNDPDLPPQGDKAATKIGVDPVVATNAVTGEGDDKNKAPPTKVIGVDPVTVTNGDATGTQGAAPPAAADDDDDDDDDDALAKAESTIKGFWEWVKEKADKLWKGVTGNSS